MTKPGLLIFALLAAASCAAAVAGSDVDARLQAGEVVALEPLPAPEGQGPDHWPGGMARMQMLVQAPARTVWAVIVSCDQAYRFLAGLRSCEVLEESNGRALVHQVIDQGWYMPRYDFVFESLREPYERIRVALVRGNLERLEGSWRFEETPAGTLVEHQLAINPAGPVPQFLVRRNLTGTLPDMLACVRALAQGSGSEELRDRDLARCQPAATAPG